VLAADVLTGDVVVRDSYAPVEGKPALRRKGPAVVTFQLGKQADVVVEIHANADYEAKLVKTIKLGKKEPGRIEVEWDGMSENGEAIHKSWRVFSCTVKTGQEQAQAFWFAPDVLDKPKDAAASLTVVPGKDRLLAEGDEPVPFALQVLNAGEGEAAFTLDGSVIGPDKAELLKVAGELRVPPMCVAARTWSLRQTRNGICSASFSAAWPAGTLKTETTFGRVSPREKAFERDSPFASVWFDGCKFGDAIGVKYSRQNDTNWTDIQKQPDQPYAWGDPLERARVLDGFAADRAANHMWQLSILGYGEDWLGGSYIACVIFNYDRFVNDYCVEVFRHMKNRYSLVQFWNEPNFFWHVPMDQYYAVQQRVFSRIKTLDKNAFIMGDGHAGVDSNNKFTERMVQLGYAPFATAIAVHYPESHVDWNSPEGRIDTKVNNLGKLFDLRDKHFPAIEIWNTEEGLWGEGPYQKDAALSARDLPKIYITQIAAGVERVFWFAMQGDNLTYLLRPAGNINEPAISYAAMTRLLEGAAFMGYASPEKGIRQYLFANDFWPVIVAWSNVGDKEASIFTAAKEVTVLDVYGNEKTVGCTDGFVKLTLTASPVYVSKASPLLLIDALQTQRHEQPQTPAPLLTDAPALMAGIRTAAKDAGVPDDVVSAFENDWNAALGKIRFCYQSYGRELPDLGENHPFKMAQRMVTGSTDLRKAFEAACAKKENIPAAVSGLVKLDSLLERLAEIAAIWFGMTESDVTDLPVQRSWDAADAALGKAEGTEYKPAARAYLAHVQKVIRKALRSAQHGMATGSNIRAMIAEAGCGSVQAIAAGEPATVISCVVNVYVNPEKKALDRYMKLFDRNVVPGESFAVEVNIDNYAKQARSGKLSLLLPDGWTCKPATVNVSLAPESLASAAAFNVTMPADAELKKQYQIRAQLKMPGLDVRDVFPVTITAVPAAEVTAIVADNAAKPASIVPHVVCNVEAADLTVSIQPPAGVQLATTAIVLGAAKPGSIRNPHFPLTQYPPDQELAFTVTCGRGDHHRPGGKKQSAEFTLKLGGDGRPAPDEFFAWEKSLQKRDFTDFAQGLGSWADSGTGAVKVENGVFIGLVSRREMVHFAKSAEVGECTLDLDVWQGGRGGHANGAPVFYVSREQRDKPHPHTAFRAAQINTYSRSACFMDETWRPIGAGIAFRGKAAEEIAGEQWIHVKVACRGDELTLFLNDWPVHRLKEQPLAERWLNIMNGYDYITKVDNVLLRYNER